ncbi:MAG: hypothetical protein PVF73_08025 [Bacteroidales bacterium]|jgi:hypothetical protein
MNKSRKNIKRLIYQRIRQRDFERQNRRRKRQKKQRIQHHEPPKGLPVPRKFRRSFSSSPIVSPSSQNQKPQKNNYLKKHLPPNLEYLVKTKESPFNLESIKKERFISKGVIEIPKVFSIIEEPGDSYIALRKIISALLIENNKTVILNYQNCEKVELGSQVLLDIILKDFFYFTNKCQKIDRNHREFFPSTIRGENINNEDVQKMMFSVGSPVTLKIREQRFPDIIPYKLCIHDNEKEKNYDRRIEQKELDTTEMADYVIDCLERMNQKLTPAKRDDLCTVIGEILINAEEHSSTKYRFSIGYFKEENIENKHYGIFRLVILNFGQTIYNKFKDESCPNKEIVEKMKSLSNSYTTRSLFSKKEFEEENLWTLYALQEEVSSISPTEYKRGNGSIRFIESFFNIKGSQEADNISYLTLQSGKTRIHFNGEYNIENKTTTNNDTFKVMTFNESGSIEDKPDNKYVYQTNDYFPGTIISAKLLLNDDDLVEINI